MILQITFAAAILFLGGTASMADIVERAESTELKMSDGKIIPRVVRNEDGYVTRLNLRDMELSQEDFKALGKLEHLNALSLVNTNTADDDLLQLKHCKDLKHLNLTSTKISDLAIDTILELKSLKSLCLGNVRLTPEAVERLKERNKERTGVNQLRFGYTYQTSSVGNKKKPE